MSYEYVAKKINGKKIDEHRLVWEQCYGEIPEGYVVHHKDENKKNNDISNLELMTLEEHSKLHSDKIAKWIKDNPDLVLEKNRKATEKQRIIGEEGTAWCGYGEHFAPIEMFSKNRNNWNGLERYCKECRSAYRSKK